MKENRKKTKPWKKKAQVIYGEHSITVNGVEMRLESERIDRQKKSSPRLHKQK